MPKIVVRVLCATTLLAADLNGSSDPYCICKVGQSTCQTKRIPKTLNPTWNEAFELSFEEKDTKTLELEVFDHDFVGGHDSLGTVNISLDDLVMGVEKVFWVKLEGGETGENIVGTIGSMLKKRKKKGKNNAPVIFNKGQVQIGLTAVDFGYGLTVNATLQRSQSMACKSSFNIHSFGRRSSSPIVNPLRPRGPSIV